VNCRGKRRRFSGTMAAGLGVLGVLVGAPIASAATIAFATVGSPEYVSGYGSWANAYGNWTGSRVSSTSLSSRLSTGYYKYFDAADHTVYVHLDSAASGSYYASSDSSHDNIYSSSYTAFRSLPSHSLASSSNPALVKGTVSTCLDVPWRFDPCSGGNTVSANI